MTRLTPLRGVRALLVIALAVATASPAFAQGRTRQREGDSDGGTAVPRNPSPPPAPAPSPAPSAAPPPSSPPPAAAPRRAPDTNGASGGESGSTGSTGRAQPRQAREGRPTGGVAVPRGSVPTRGSGVTTIYVPRGYYGGYWPWGFGGLGFGGYYYSAFDPFYSPGYAPAYVAGPFHGSLRLKVKPRDAQVFVDGLYVGLVDDFDGIFQHLNLDPGPHHVEVRKDGFETMTLDVQIREDVTTKFEGELRATQ